MSTKKRTHEYHRPLLTLHPPSAATPLRSSLQESGATIPDFARAPLSAIARAHTGGRLRLSGRHLRSQPFLPASAEKAPVKISHRDAATNHARRWQVRARVASSRDGKARRESVRETARAWRAVGETAAPAELRRPTEICRPRAWRRIRAAVRDRPATPLCNFRAGFFRKLAG